VPLERFGVRHDEEIAHDGSPMAFQLRIAIDRVDLEKTFAEQGIVGSTLTTVISTD
jgi:hypothetical protein